jgi:predicted TIM-barrel fold metal-dependent hydrolase
VARAAPARRAGRIDVQFHFVPDFYRDALQARKLRAGSPWSVPAALGFMDDNGIRAGMLSVSAPGVDFLSAPDSVAMARQLNEAAAAVVRDHPARFGAFATLPMQDVAATLSEVKYALDVLKLDGVCMLSNCKGHYLGHTAYAPIFDELNRRRAAIYVHPTNPTYTGSLEMAEVATEWPFDTARAAVDLIYSGTLRRCPDVTIILAHAGGGLMGVARRAEEAASQFSKVEPKISLEEAVAAVRRFYYDLAVSAHDSTLAALRELTTIDHLLFGTDWPFAFEQAISWNVEGFKALKLTRSERAAIEYGNAEHLFPRLKASQE